MRRVVCAWREALPDLVRLAFVVFVFASGCARGVASPGVSAKAVLHKQLPQQLGRVALLGPEVDPALLVAEEQVPEVVAWFHLPAMEMLSKSLGQSGRIKIIDVAPDEVTTVLSDTMSELGLTDFINPRSGRFAKMSYAAYIQKVAAKLDVDGVLALRLVPVTALVERNVATGSTSLGGALVGWAVGKAMAAISGTSDPLMHAFWDGEQQMVYKSRGTNQKSDGPNPFYLGSNALHVPALSLHVLLVHKEAGLLWEKRTGWHLLYMLDKKGELGRVPVQVMLAREDRRGRCLAKSLEPLVDVLR
jgi:hypothetical protein